MRTGRPLATRKRWFYRLSVNSKYGDGGSRGAYEKERVDGESDGVSRLRTQEKTGPTAEQAAGTKEQGQRERIFQREILGSGRRYRTVTRLSFVNLCFFPRHLCEDKADVRHVELARCGAAGLLFALLQRCCRVEA